MFLFNKKESQEVTGVTVTKVQGHLPRTPLPCHPVTTLVNIGTRNILVSRANSPGIRRVFHITYTGWEQEYLTDRG